MLVVYHRTEVNRNGKTRALLVIVNRNFCAVLIISRRRKRIFHPYIFAAVNPVIHHRRPVIIIYNAGNRKVTRNDFIVARQVNFCYRKVRLAVYHKFI